MPDADASRAFELEALMVYPTLKCNLRCRFCYQSDFATELSNDTLAALESSFGTLEELQVVGGEISTSRRIFDWVERVSREHPRLKVHLTTNGTAFDDRWIAVAVRHGIDVTVSINSFDVEAYAAVAQHADAARRSWTLAFRNLVVLRRTADRYGRRDIAISVAKVMLPGEYADLPAFLDTASTLGLNVRLLWDCREAEIARDAADEFLGQVAALTTTAPGGGAVRVSGLRGHAALGGQRYLRPATVPLPTAPGLELEPLELDPATFDAPKFSTEGTFCNFGAGHRIMDGVPVCAAPWRSAVVTADGRVMFCPNLHSYVLGNVAEAPLEALLGSPRADAFRREMLAGHCGHCPSWCATRPSTTTTEGGA